MPDFSSKTSICPVERAPTRPAATTMQAWLALAALSLLLLPLLPHPTARAQAPGQNKLNVSVLDDRVSLGEFGTLIYTVTGGEARMPETIQAEGLEIVHHNNQLRAQIVQGAQTFQMTYFYRFRGFQPGTYIIPSLTTTVGRDTLTAPPVEVTIFERDQNAPPDATRSHFSRLDLSKDSFYVNELVPFTLVGFAKGRDAIDSVTRPDFSHDSFVVREFKEVHPDGAEIGSVYYSSRTLPSTLFALREGEHRLGPATVVMRVVESGGRFGVSSFFSRTTTKELATNTVNVSVKPLPRDAPLSFTGGVGRFEMSASPSTTEVAVGDPVSLEFVVTGVGNLRTMDAPVFAVPPTDLWRSYEPSKRLEDEDDSDGFSPGRAVFSRVIIPEARVASIPVFELTYFDPAAERYVTLSTDPVPITVSAESRDEGAAAFGAPPAPGDEGAAPRAPVLRPPTARHDDMLHIRTRPPRQWLARGETRGAGPAFYAVQTLLSVSFFTLLAFGVARRWKRRTAPAPGERPLTFRQAMRRLPRERGSKRRFYLTVSAALAAWRAGRPQAPPKVLEVVDRVSERCELILYGGHDDADAAVDPSEAEKLISMLKKLPPP